MTRRVIPPAALVAVAALLLAGCGGDTATGRVYFLVAESSPRHGDSYLLPLTEATDIAAARALIAGSPEVGRIVVARIAPGASDGVAVNCDLLGGGRAWSWHVSAFLGFADSTIEILDGWPGYVEQNLEEWLRITRGEIGFWSYTVIREVSEGELAGAAAAPGRATVGSGAKPTRYER